MGEPLVVEGRGEGPETFLGGKEEGRNLLLTFFVGTWGVKDIPKIVTVCTDFIFFPFGVSRKSNFQKKIGQWLRVYWVL